MSGVEGDHDDQRNFSIYDGEKQQDNYCIDDGHCCCVERNVCSPTNLCWTLLNFQNMPNLLHLEETSSMLLNVTHAVLLVTDCNDNPCELRVVLLLLCEIHIYTTALIARKPTSYLCFTFIFSCC